jgi:hypothetical protein
MPYYSFINPLTQEVKDVFFHMNDVKEYSTDGVKWERLYAIPRASIDTHCDEFSQKDFLKRTHKTCKVGDLMDLSAEMSEKRKERAGVDPIQQRVFADYKRATNKPHPQDRPKKIETKDFELEL